MQSLKVIALNGPKGSGKDTVAKVLQKIIGDDIVKQIAFADPIKKEILRLFNLKSLWDYDSFKRSELTFEVNSICSKIEGRHIVREIGMLMRSYDEQQFNNYVETSILSKPKYVWVITDLRFDNEYVMLKRLGATIAKVTNNRVKSEDSHITERGFDSSLNDFILPNHGSMDMLVHTCKDFILQIKEKNEAWSDIQI
jgi:dephospho-CoA kinase